jgi:alpha-glucosidase
MGYRLYGYFTPDFHPDRASYAEPDAAGYLVHSPQGGSYRHPQYDVSWLDFTNPDAVAWWQTGVRRALVDLNLDGGMLDLGELLPEDARFANGRDGVAGHNAYVSLYHRAAWEEAQRSKPDAVFWMRAGATGDQRTHSVTWSGDPIDSWDAVTGIKSLVPAALSAGLSGYPYWYTEVSGYVQSLPHEQERQLWLRWLQLGAFTAMLRDAYGDKPNDPVDLWTDQETLAEYLRYAALHQRLAPYLYSLAREAHETGLPLLRHYALQYPDDPAAWGVEDAYLLGPDLLVAPILDPDVGGRGVHLPPGEWVDFWTGERVDGGGDRYVAADAHTIPAFLRAGAVLPLLPDGVHSLAEPGWDDTLVLQAVPATTETRSSLTLFDGGVVTATVTARSVDVAVSGGPARTYQVLVPAGGRPEVLEGELVSIARNDHGPGRVTVRGASIRVRAG